MKINRLFEIVYILLDKEKVTAKELADYFEVSTRTIYRDVEDLSSGGIPIYMNKGKNGGIYLLPEYVLNKTVLTETEKINILSALQSLNSLDESSMELTLSKLSSFFGENNTGFFEIDYKDWGSLIKEQFDMSKQAILLRKLLEFEYISSTSKTSQRTVEPYKLWFKERNWYLKGFCSDKEDLRVFRLSRMKNVKIKEEHFIPRNIDFDLHLDEKITYPTTKITMRVESNLSYRILDEFSDSDVFENEDGSFTVKMDFIEDEWLYGYILSFGKYATVIEPKRIKNIIKGILEKSLENYS